MRLVDVPWLRDLTAKEAAAFVMSQTPGVRLTLTQGTPVTTTDVTGATSIFAEPMNGGVVPLFRDAAGTVPRIMLLQPSTLSLALGTVAAFAGFDVFAYDARAGSLGVEKLEWANATVTMTIASPCVVTWTGNALANGNTVSLTTTGALPTGLSANTQYYVVGLSGDTFNLATTPGGAAINTSGSQSGTHTGHSPNYRATAVDLVNGRYYKHGDYTRLLVGSFMATSATATEDSAGGVSANVGGKRFLWNAFNRRKRPIGVIEGTASWSYTTFTWRQAHANAGNKVEFFVGIAEDTLELELSVGCAMANGGPNAPGVALGIDSITAPTGLQALAYTASTTLFTDLTAIVPYRAVLSAGYHYAAWLERGAGSNCGFGAGGIASGITGEVHC